MPESNAMTTRQNKPANPTSKLYTNHHHHGGRRSTSSGSWVKVRVCIDSPGCGESIDASYVGYL